MDFGTDCEKLLGCANSIDKIAVLDSSKYQKYMHPMYQSSINFSQKSMSDIIDSMGEKSAKVFQKI